MSVKEVFDRYAEEYDRTRKQLIPCFDDFYRTVIDLLGTMARPRMKVLDLGAGTGLLSGMILERFPESEILMADISEGMLARAEKRFRGSGARVSFRVMDYSSGGFGEGYDAVVSALSIHHLHHGEKRKLFARIHGALKEGGVFINAEQVLGATERMERTCWRIWLDRMAASGVPEETIAAAVERMEEDNAAPLEDQLEWLKAEGFSHVSCWYRHFSFAVYSGFRGRALPPVPEPLDAYRVPC